MIIIYKELKDAITRYLNTPKYQITQALELLDLSDEEKINKLYNHMKDVVGE